MIHQSHRKTFSLYLIADLLATVAAFFAAWTLRFDLQIIPVTRAVPSIGPYLMLLPFLVVVWPLVFYFHGLYQNRRTRGRVDEMLGIVSAVVLANLMLLAFTGWYRPTVGPDSLEYVTFSRAFLVIFAVMNLLLIALARLFVRALLRRRRSRGEGVERILVVGAGQLGQEVTQKILNHQEYGFEVIGFVDDDPGKSQARFHGVPVLGSLKEIDRVLDEQPIDQVFIALPLEAHRKMLRIIERVSRECVDVRIVPDVLQYATLNAAIENLDGTPVINLSQVPLQGWYSLMKRAMDVALSAAAILGLSPFLPVLAFLIWREDRGPVFYKQERMGLDGKSFMIYKFRSMRIDAESTTGPVWAVKGDPRRTRLGTFLREWSIDELPQLWNVLKGDMSIVGPRPERPAFVQEFKHKIPQYMMRHRVKAGITGWAQVHGWRGNTSLKKRIQYDLYYIQNWSLFLDVKILWMTVRSGIWHNAH